MLSTISSYSAGFPTVTNDFALCFQGRLSKELANSDCGVFQLGSPRMSRPWSVWKARSALNKLLRKNQYEIAICHSPWPYAVFAKTVDKTNSLNVFWTHQFLDGNGVDQRLSQRRKPDLVVCNSRYTKGSVKNLFEGVRSEVVYCPHALRPQSTSSQTSEELRSANSTSMDAVVVLQASRMEYWKGQRLLLKSLARVRSEQQWVLWLAGGAQRKNEQAYVSELKSLACELGIQSQVRFLGQRQDVPALLASCDIVCQPNEAPEHFGLFYVEGLAAGKPVVASDMGGASEIITPDCGILCEPKVDSLAATLESLIGSPQLRDRLGRNGPARAKFLCDPNSRLKQLYDILNEAKGS